MSLENTQHFTSPWFNDGFLHTMGRGTLFTLKIESEGFTIAGVEKRARFGLRVLQVGSHFGVGLSGTTRGLLHTLRSIQQPGLDAISIISPYELKALEAYRTANSTGTILLTLAPGDEELWTGIRKSFKGCINQGTKKGNSIRWNDPQDLAAIEALYRHHVAAKGYDGIEWEVVKGLHGLTESEFQLDLGLVRDPSGNPAAMAAILICGETATYFVGGSSPDSLPFYPGHFMHWNAILRYKKMGCRRYDFGGATEDPNKVAYEITKFKRGFGGEYATFYTYEVPLSFRYGLYRASIRLVKACLPRKRL